MSLGKPGGVPQGGEQDDGGGLKQAFGPGREGDPVAQHRAGEPERERARRQRDQAGREERGVLHGVFLPLAVVSRARSASNSGRPGGRNGVAASAMTAPLRAARLSWRSRSPAPIRAQLPPRNMPP